MKKFGSCRWHSAAVAQLIALVVSGCEYSNLDSPQTTSNLSPSPAYQAYLRPVIDPVSLKLVEQTLVIRDRRTGEQRVVDSVIPRGANSDQTSRTLTFGQFSSDVAGGQAQLNEVQNRRLVYLTRGNREEGGQLKELVLDDKEAPTRILSTEADARICNIMNPILYQFSDIDRTGILLEGPGTTGSKDCLATNERPTYLVELGAGETRALAPLKADFIPVGRPLDPEGRVRGLLVVNEFSEDVTKTDLLSCPFPLVDRESCLPVRRFTNMDGCRRRDGCVGRAACETSKTCGSSDGLILPFTGSPFPFADASNKTLAGPVYRLSNQFFRVGRLVDPPGQEIADGAQPVGLKGELVLYVDNPDLAPGVSPDLPFLRVHPYETVYRRSGFINLEDLDNEKPGRTVIAQSPRLQSIMAVVESPDSGAGGKGDPDYMFFADGGKLYRAAFNRSQLAAFDADRDVARIFSSGADAALPGGEILDVRPLGHDIVFRWCGPIVRPPCQKKGDVICKLATDSCPNNNDNKDEANLSHQQRQILFAVPIDGGPARRLDEIVGGRFVMEQLTSSAWTYTRELHLADDGKNRREADSVLRQAMLIVASDKRSGGFVRAALNPAPGDERPYDGSRWLDGLQQGESAASGGDSAIRSKFGGGDSGIDVISTLSFVVALRTNASLDTEIYSLDLSDLRPEAAKRVGVIPHRHDLREHPDCQSIGPRPAEALPVLPGANGGAISGYGRDALIQLNIPRSAADETSDPPLKAIGDTDIYAVDLGVENSLVPVSITAPPAALNRRVYCPGESDITPAVAHDQLINR